MIDQNTRKIQRDYYVDSLQSTHTPSVPINEPWGTTNEISI